MIYLSSYFIKIIKIIFVNTIILFFLLVLLELTLRIINPNYILYKRTYPGQYKDKTFFHEDIHVNWPQKDSVLGWVCNQQGLLKFSNRELNEKQIYYRINKNGFRDSLDFDDLEDTANKRLLFLGDSFLFGVYNSEDFVITNMMKEKHPKDDFLNLGVPGYGIDQMYLSYLAFSKKIKPNVVLLVYIDDDIFRIQEAYRVTEGMNKPSFGLEKDKLVKRIMYDKNIFSEFCERSFLFNRFYWKYIEYENFKIIERIFIELKERTRMANQEFVIIRLPMKDGFEKSNLVEKYSMKKFCWNNDILYYDVYDELDKKLVPIIYFENDGHFNKNGNKMIAELISQYLMKLGLI